MLHFFRIKRLYIIISKSSIYSCNYSQEVFTCSLLRELIIKLMMVPG